MFLLMKYVRVQAKFLENNRNMQDQITLLKKLVSDSFFASGNLSLSTASTIKTTPSTPDAN